MTSFSNLLKATEKLVSDNSPAILTAVGVAGTITTAVLSGQATLKANDIILAEEARRQFYNTNAGELALPEMEFKEKALLTWREFVPAGVVCGCTIAAIVLSNRIGTRRASALAAAYSLTDKAFSEYKEKVVEQIGKNKEQKVRDEIMQDRMAKQPVGGGDIFGTGNGSDLCFEKLTGRYFYSSMENIKHAQNRVNHDIVNGVYASLSDFYDYLGLPHTGISDELGWNGDHLMEITFSTTMADNNAPCIAFEYHTEPVRNYFRVH